MPAALRIGVNALYLIPGGVGGTEIYLRNLLIGLAEIDCENQYFIFTNRETGADLVPKRPNFTMVPLPVRARFRPARILWEQTGLPLACRRLRLQVLLNPGFTCPVWAPCPNVAVFHDLQHRRRPEHFRWFDLPFWRLLLWAAVRRSRALISVSKATRDDLRKFYHADSTVIPHGVKSAFFRIAERRDPQNFLLCVSTLHPHKNLERLIRVHGQSDGVPKLVITGLRGFAAEKLEKLAAANVRFTGWIPRAELLELYRTAGGFVYPSTFEGFGLPVLEAMAAGVPVACSDIPPLREIAAECVFFFDPDNEAQMREAMLRSLRDTSLTQAAQRRAMLFTWPETARATLAVLTKAGNKNVARR